MKLITGVAVYASAVMAYVNTAPMFSSKALLDNRYLTDAHDVSSQLENLTKDWCSQEQKLPMIIYRVKNLAKGSNDLAEAFTNVRYESPSQLDLTLHSLCQVHYSTNNPSELNAGEVYVVDLDDDSNYKVNDLLSEDAFVTVQGKPNGGKARSFMAGIKEYVDDFQQGWAKRQDEQDEADAEAFEEIESAFRAAESLIAHEEGDSFVTALAEDKETSSGSEEQKQKTDGRSNLFTKYQFFTPGIWLCLIISLFLVYVLLTAVGWISSIQITYKSFEKQVDYEKKTE